MRRRLLSGAVIAAGLIVMSTVSEAQARPHGRGKIMSAAACHRLTDDQVIGLFARWNASLDRTPDAVADNYAERSTLLPTVENGPYTTREQKLGYFDHFLANKPTGTVVTRTIFTGCDYAVDTGLYDFLYRASGKTVNARYTFTYGYERGQWLITSHHSSKLPIPKE